MHALSYDLTIQTNEVSSEVEELKNYSNHSESLR